ncbi:MAG: UDP-N-acetylmuramate dehydrogenase [Pseudomonadota bacterium]|nr:UDP-N-acetylmuramate dehydrogenase [Pseudomonadota bacterium]
MAAEAAAPGAAAGKARLRGVLREHEPMQRHCSWRAGGTARRFFVPADQADLQLFLQTCAPDEPLYVVGLGSNLLVRDGGLDATVVLTHGALSGLRVEERDGETLVDADAGVAAPKVARFAARHGLEGAEFLAGIPGTIGGALAMNAGCYGSDTWTHVVEVTTIDHAGQLRVRAPGDFRVGYRQVAIGRSPGTAALAPLGEWFLSARLRFVHGDGRRSAARIRELLTRRIASQPLQQPNAGSVFRNPQGDHAARLIESCGLKGFRIGGAEVSRRHANFIVNVGAATAADIETLIARVQQAVAAQTSVHLEPEVRIVGRDAA